MLFVTTVAALLLNMIALALGLAGGFGLTYLLSPHLIFYFGTLRTNSPKIEMRLKTLKADLDNAYAARDAVRQGVRSEIEHTRSLVATVPWFRGTAAHWITAWFNVVEENELNLERARRAFDRALGAAFLGGAGRIAARVLS